MTHPFKDYGNIKADYDRYDLTLKRLPNELAGRALDLGIANPFTPLLQKAYSQLEITNTEASLDFDIDALPFAERSFDVVFSFEVIEHLINPLWNLLECRRVLNDEGKLFMTTPVGVFPAKMWLDTHFHELDAKRIKILAERAGFKLCRIERFNKSPLYWWKMGLIRPTLRILLGGWFYIELQKT